jgi:hypothetical protein
MTPPPGTDRLTRRERLALLAFGLLVLAFGVVTEVRSTYLTTRKTDAGVYFRAAWAARTGHDLFAATDDNGWHYCYPPVFALALTPLADPPPGEPRGGFLPYELSVALWYLFGVACVGWAAHALAGTVLPDAVRGSRRWWYARTIPVYVCAGGIGHTLGRGQVNLLVVALASAGFAAAVRNRRFRSGTWLAAAAAVKVIPAFLVLFPLARRDRRGLVGFAAGCALLFAVVPALWWGDGGMIDGNRQLVEQVIRPGATGDGDQTRAEELTRTTSTDSQSFVAVIHAWKHPDPETRPADASREARLSHWAIAGLLTLVTVWVGWKRFPPSSVGQASSLPELSAGWKPAPRKGAADRLVFLGCLCAVMLLVSPVSHLHYHVFALPLVAGLWLRALAARPGEATADRRTTLVLVAWGAATALPLLPGEVFDRLREGGFAVAATLALWAVGLRSLRRPRVAGTPPVLFAATVRLALPDSPPVTRSPHVPAAAPVLAE